MLGKMHIGQIRKDMETHIGHTVQLKTNKGRKKSVVRQGVLESTYPNVFVVKFENDFENTRRVSFSYTDVLTRSVELVVVRNADHPAS